ncbi:hypothetical protein SAMN05443287_101836 [Micromonospora phaseoli]|uniref:Uncharacterized protein n=1 Tax=Micromonospora phaseoli TaxID=1144548 RepID=A0A1H6SS14_9ACTN|nr:hypothetical protein CLV64_101836 [Micromonospora phaseoli]SEI70758.1 hypothetical protein SAMN05443287_101836 [Micromonospora phaseoli]
MGWGGPAGRPVVGTSRGHGGASRSRRSGKVGTFLGGAGAVARGGTTGRAGVGPGGTASRARRRAAGTARAAGHPVRPRRTARWTDGYAVRPGGTARWADGYAVRPGGTARWADGYAIRTSRSPRCGRRRPAHSSPARWPRWCTVRANRRPSGATRWFGAGPGGRRFVRTPAGWVGRVGRAPTSRRRTVGAARRSSAWTLRPDLRATAPVGGRARRGVRRPWPAGTAVPAAAVTDRRRATGRCATHASHHGGTGRRGGSLVDGRQRRIGVVGTAGLPQPVGGSLRATSPAVAGPCGRRRFDAGAARGAVPSGRLLLVGRSSAPGWRVLQTGRAVGPHRRVRSASRAAVGRRPLRLGCRATATSRSGRVVLDGPASPRVVPAANRRDRVAGRHAGDLGRVAGQRHHRGAFLGLDGTPATYPPATGRRTDRPAGGRGGARRTGGRRAGSGIGRTGTDRPGEASGTAVRISRRIAAVRREPPSGHIRRNRALGRFGRPGSPAGTSGCAVGPAARHSALPGRTRHRADGGTRHRTGRRTGSRTGSRHRPRAGRCGRNRLAGARLPAGRTGGMGLLRPAGRRRVRRTGLTADDGRRAGRWPLPGTHGRRAGRWPRGRVSRPGTVDRACAWRFGSSPTRRGASGRVRWCGMTGRHLPASAGRRWDRSARSPTAGRGWHGSARSRAAGRRRNGTGGRSLTWSLRPAPGWSGRARCRRATLGTQLCALLLGRAEVVDPTEVLAAARLLRGRLCFAPAPAANLAPPLVRAVVRSLRRSHC